MVNGIIGENVATVRLIPTEMFGAESVFEFKPGKCGLPEALRASYLDSHGHLASICGRSRLEWFVPGLGFVRTNLLVEIQSQDGLHRWRYRASFRYGELDVIGGCYFEAEFHNKDHPADIDIYPPMLLSDIPEDKRFPQPEDMVEC